jgi:hypothetical protein
LNVTVYVFAVHCAEKVTVHVITVAVFTAVHQVGAVNHQLNVYQVLVGFVGSAQTAVLYAIDFVVGLCPAHHVASNVTV